MLSLDRKEKEKCKNKYNYILLGENYNGKGIMTDCVKDLVKLAFEYYLLQKV